MVSSFQSGVKSPGRPFRPILGRELAVRLHEFYLSPFDLTIAVFFTRDVENIFAKFELGMPDGETDDGAQYVMRRATGGAHSSLWLPCGNRQPVKAQPHARRASESQLSLGFCLRAYSARRNTKA